MAMTQLFRFSVLLVLSQLLCRGATQRCRAGGSEQSVFGWMLKGHVYKTMMAELGHVCLLACRQDDRCQSFNFVISRHMCEFSNRTKEARPEDFIPNPDRFYFRRDIKRVPLGFIPELPGKSCKEIKESEKGQAVSGKYWFDTIKRGVSVLANCDMESEDVDECSASCPVCHDNATCQNTLGSYICSCKEGFTGDGRTCEDVDECATDTHNCSRNGGKCNNTKGSYKCQCKPGFTGDGRNCSDIDECAKDTHNCSRDGGECNNTKGSYKCQCKPGFTGDGRNCSDIDECAKDTHNCSRDGGECNNTKGSYKCQCKPGFAGDGHNCTVLLPLNFTTNGRKGRQGSIQKFTVPRSARYLIKAWGARGGTHSYNYGYKPGTYYGGRGAYKEGNFSLNKGTVLNIVVGQRGGDSVEVKGGQSTNRTAAELGLSVEDNAGTGGGGGSFVYTTSNALLLAAGGGGGASSGYNGVDGQAGTNGTSSVGRYSSRVRKGGSGGQPGQCNTAGGYWHGGVGAGWFAEGCSRARPQHGERGGSRAQGWVGGRAGGMNSGYNGAPPPGAVGGFGGGGGGSEDNGASGGGGGYSGGGSGTHRQQAGGGGGSYCSGTSCSGVTGGNLKDDGLAQIIELSD